MGTKIGTPANSMYAGFLSTKLDYEIGFLQFIAIGLPVVLVLIPVSWWLLWRLTRGEALGKAQAAEVISAELTRLGPFGRTERKVAVVFTIAALLWIAGGPLRDLLAPVFARLFGVKLLGKHYEAGVAMGAALVLMLWGALPPKALKRVPWSALLLLGGSFALAAGIEGSGLSVWMTRKLSAVASMPLFGQLALASFSTILLSALASNTATVNVMLNVLPPSLPVLTTSALASSCDFALPAGTPPNAIVFGSGYVRLDTMMKSGVALDLISGAFLTLYGYAVITRLV
jgi:sodium-dependent dicarboxylate transporter 2/3/5